MKKIVSFVLAIVLVLSASVFSFAAADENIIEYNWDSAVDIVVDVFPSSTKMLYVEEVDAYFWLPDAYLLQELTPEDLENNSVGCFLSGSGNSLVYLTYSDQGITLDTYYAALKQNGYDVEMVSVNDIPAVIFRNAENDAMFLIFQTQEGKIFQFMFTPYLDEGLSTIYNLIISSIQPHVEEVPEEPVSSENPVSKLISK